jgi:uncharacterized membrane protein YgcG
MKILCLLGCLVLSLPVMARTLHWEEIKVSAFLKASGELEIIEDQSFVFNGFWNGGERSFVVNEGEKFKFHGVDKFVDGEWKPLNRGNLTKVDDYKMLRGNILRWRIFEPATGAPPVKDYRVRYRIRYSYKNIIKVRNGELELNHNFLFPDRMGRVEKFILDFRMDTGWGDSRGSTEIYKELKNLQPGESYYVRSFLSGRNAGPYIQSYRPLYFELDPRLVVAFLFLIYFGAIFSFHKEVMLRERERGRFEPLPSSAEITEEWLDDNVFKYPAEMVAATWDEAVDTTEIAVVMAQMEMNGKLKTQKNESKGLLKKIFNEDVYQITMLIPREDFSSTEKIIVDRIFVDGKDDITTEEIEKYYREKRETVSITGDLSTALEAKRSNFPELEKIELKPTSILRSMGLISVTVFCILASIVDRGNIPQQLIQFIYLAVFSGISLSFGFAARLQTEHSLKRYKRLKFIAFMPWIFFLTLQFAFNLYAGFWILLAGTFFALAAASSLFNQAKSRATKKRMGVRIKLAAARKHFRNELAKAAPELNDEWIPYIIGLGLGKELEKWHQYHGVAEKLSHRHGDYSHHPHHMNTGSNFGSSGSSWSGGGGGFSGAGASGSWIAASNAVASSVISSTSSGSSGGGGGGSGGGGGGGW